MYQGVLHIGYEKNLMLYVFSSFKYDGHLKSIKVDVYILNLQ